MAERTGIPKRTLDKYMLRNGANLPGFEALLALSKGLGVSLDWLATGADLVGEGTELISAMAAERVALSYFETLLRYHSRGDRAIFEGEEILRLTPEEWAADVGVRVGEKARELASQGITRQELLEWNHSSRERLGEILRDRMDRIRADETDEK